MHSCAIWQYRLSSFQVGDTKLEKNLPKNQHTKRKLLNSEKVPKFDFQSQFHHRNLPQLKDINFLGAHFLLLTFFDNINF